jgi:hypothetical protein
MELPTLHCQKSKKDIWQWIKSIYPQEWMVSEFMMLKKVTRILWLRWVPVLTIDPGDTALLECRESTRGAGYDGIASACD